MFRKVADFEACGTQRKLTSIVQAGRNLAPTHWRHVARQATSPDDRDIGPVDKAGIVGETLIAVIGRQGLPAYVKVLAPTAGCEGDRARSGSLS